MKYLPSHCQIMVKYFVMTYLPLNFNLQNNTFIKSYSEPLPFKWELRIFISDFERVENFTFKIVFSNLHLKPSQGQMAPNYSLIYLINKTLGDKN